MAAKTAIYREPTPGEEERSALAQEEILHTFDKYHLSYEEGLSAMTWLMARIMYSACTWPAGEWVPGIAVRLEGALRHIERQEQQGKVPLA